MKGIVAHCEKLDIKAIHISTQKNNTNMSVLSHCITIFINFSSIY